VVLFVHRACDPVQDVEGTVRAKADEVVGIDDGRDGGLTEEEELWQNGDRFEDLRKCPKDLLAGIGIST